MKTRPAQEVCIANTPQKYVPIRNLLFNIFRNELRARCLSPRVQAYQKGPVSGYLDEYRWGWIIALSILKALWILFFRLVLQYGVRNLKGILDDTKIGEALLIMKMWRMFEIKMSQGAKPGKGGMLSPGAKSNRRKLLILVEYPAVFLVESWLHLAQMVIRYKIHRWLIKYRSTNVRQVTSKPALASNGGGDLTFFWNPNVS